MYVTEKELEDGSLQYSMEYRNDLGNGFAVILVARGSYVDFTYLHIIDGEVIQDTSGITMPANCAVALVTMLNGVLAQVTEDRSKFS